MLGLGPAGSAHHLLTHNNHTALKAAAQRPRAGSTLRGKSTRYDQRALPQAGVPMQEKQGFTISSTKLKTKRRGETENWMYSARLGSTCLPAGHEAIFRNSRTPESITADTLTMDVMLLHLRDAQTA